MRLIVCLIVETEPFFLVIYTPATKDYFVFSSLMYVVVLLLRCSQLNMLDNLAIWLNFWLNYIFLIWQMLNVETALGVLLISQIQGHLLLLMSFSTSSSCLKDQGCFRPQILKNTIIFENVVSELWQIHFTSDVKLILFHKF